MREPAMTIPAGIEVSGPRQDRYGEILTPGALGFLADLHRTFDGRRRELLARRREREAELAAGGTLDFLEETKDVREGDWRGAEPAPGLLDRRGEVPGPHHAQAHHKPLNSRGKGRVADH